MTPFAIAFVLFVVPLAATLPRLRIATAGAWMLLMVSCALMAYVAAGTLTQDASRVLAAPTFPVIGGFGFEVTPLGALFLLVTVTVFAAALPLALCDAAEYRSVRRSLFVALLAAKAMAG